MLPIKSYRFIRLATLFETNKIEIETIDKKAGDKEVNYVINAIPHWYKTIAQIIKPQNGLIEIMETECHNEVLEENIDFRLYTQAQPSKEEGNREDKHGLRCSACPTDEFESNAQLKAHFKSQWHVCNVQRKNNGQPILAISEYEELLLEPILPPEGKKEKNK